MRCKRAFFRLVLRKDFTHFVRKVFAGRKLLPGKFWVLSLCQPEECAIQTEFEQKGGGWNRSKWNEAVPLKNRTLYVFYADIRICGKKTNIYGNAVYIKSEYTMVTTKYHICQALARNMMKTNRKRTLKKVQNKPSCKSWVVKHQSVKFLQGVNAASNGRMYIVLRKRGQSQQNCWGL